MKITLSVIKADVGGFVGHSGIHEDIIKTAQDCLQKGVDENLLLDYRVMACGDDLQLIFS